MTARPLARALRAAALAALVSAAACGTSDLGPAALDPNNDTCRFCRMAVGDRRFAAQIVAPGEDPLFFDDLGCLTHYVTGSAPLPPGAIVYVSDYARREWVRADRAVYTRVERLDTPMGSGLIAHADAAARDADPMARTGQPVAFEDIVPPPRAGKAGR